jgi:hypothetical protein
MAMNVSQIETAIRQLPPNEFAELSDWFEEYEAEIWDNRIGADLAAGKLDEFISEAESDFENGHVKEL